METGKQNEIKKKLEELKEIPAGFQFDPQSTWQKLEAKLESRPAGKKIPWLRVAATFLFAVGAAIFFFLNKPRTKNIDPVTKTIHPPGTRKNISPQEIKTANASIPVQKKENKFFPLNKEMNVRETRNEISINQGKKIADTLDTMLANKPALHIDSTAGASTKLKTKFRIAHINELQPQEIYQTSLEPQNNKTSFSFIIKGPVVLKEDAPGNEKTTIPKKPRTMFSFISSSQ